MTMQYNDDDEVQHRTLYYMDMRLLSLGQHLGLDSLEPKTKRSESQVHPISLEHPLYPITSEHPEYTISLEPQPVPNQYTRSLKPQQQIRRFKIVPNLLKRREPQWFKSGMVTSF